jgi:hypothetical protein
MNYRPHGTLVIFAVGLCLLYLNLGGCAASRALDKPSPKNYGVLKPGTNRDLVRAELGQAQASVSKTDCDVFAFEKGSSGWKYMRAIGYSLLDIGTLGVSEVLTNPAEAGVGKDKERVRVCYDKNQNVVYSEKMQVGKPVVLLTGKYPPPSADNFTISGGISGLVGTGLALQLNGAQSTPIADNGAFLFKTGLANGQAYAITFQSQPVAPSQTCSVTQGSGTVNAANVTNVSISCVTNSYAVWGQVSGLTGSGLVLQNNGDDDLAIAGNGPVKFRVKLPSGSAYNVAIVSQPAEPEVVCAVTGGTGKIGNADVTTVAVDCVNDSASAAPATTSSAEPTVAPTAAAGAPTATSGAEPTVTPIAAPSPAPGVAPTVTPTTARP